MVHTFSPLQVCSLRTRAVVPALLLAVTLSLGGCASVPPPDSAMNQAQAQLQSARDAGADTYDPVDFGFAQDKFQQAQAAMADRKYAQAADLADESRADATLARTKALLAAARAQIQSKTDANSQLRAQNAEAQSENDQHYQQQKAQLAAQQAAAQQQANGGDNGDNGGDNGGNPASSATSPVPPSSTQLPPQAPVQQDMPAPPSSELGNPNQQPQQQQPQPQGQGFQTLPDSGQQNQGGQL
jgi:multidrug efflux pump subunit AcrA (membrane-fusion protein)